MTPTFLRDRFTWLLYLLLALYGYFLNALGPITPFLKSELNLTYTVSSLHFTAFAAGILLVGVGGHLVIRRLGRWRSLWVGAMGMSLGALLLSVGVSAAVTIGASFLMGLVGSLTLAIVPAGLSEKHGELRAVALSEANVISSLAASASPLLVGWFAGQWGNWRPALVLMAAAPVLLYLLLGRGTSLPAAPTAKTPGQIRQPLSAQYWVYWVAIVLGVSVEFCMISWSADYLETVLGLVKTDAAQAVSLFLIAMIVGRLAVSRLVQYVSAPKLVISSVLVAGVGFLLFWKVNIVWVGLAGLFITGLGVAGLYPMLLSLAIGSAGSNTVEASARATLASGTAILMLPLILGRLADMVGIGLAYGIIVFLLLGVLGGVWLAGKPASAKVEAA